jgi:hypothetical protein
MYVLFIHGPAASGKHTIGSLISQKRGIPLFHNHLTVDLVKTLFSFGTKPFADLRAQIWRASFSQAAMAKTSFVFTFNPESTVDPALIEELQKIVEENGGKVLFVELLCSDEEVARRIGNDSRAEFGKLLDADVYRELKKAGGFNFPALPEPILVIDTDRNTPDQAATAINAQLDAADEL